MTRTRVRHASHRCEACGATSPKWLGRCPECGEWGSLVEAVMGGGDPSIDPAVVMPLVEVGSVATACRPTGVEELDRVLGGGLVPGSVTLLGGEPGIGKSTLALQALARMAAT